MDILNWILENLEQLFAIVTAVIAVASLIAALTPSPKDNDVVNKASSWLGKARTIINLLALNVKNAKPKQ